MASETSNFELPKLPKLNEDDVKAVRGFLPGKLLGRTAAILSLVLLVLGFSGAVGKGLKYVFDVDLPWWGYGILLALALLAVAAQVLSEWLSERNRQAKQKLAVQAGTQQTGYFRIGPYQDTELDRARFSRPDRAEERALDWIRKSGQLPLYFTGDSGSGKSSLLNASLLPKLREEGWSVVEARAWQDPLGAIRETLEKVNKRRPKAANDQTLGQMIQQASKRASDKLLIVLDQFEEFLILASPERQREFAAFIAETQASPMKKPWLLLVLRSDYQTFLEESGLPPLRAGENLFQLGRFQFSAGTEFMKKSGLDLQPEALQTLLTSAAVLDDTPGLVRPITLNVTGYILSSGVPVAPSLDAGTLVRTYIEQTVQQPGLRDGGLQLLEHMITEQGTKQPRSEKDLAQAAKLRPAEVGVGAAVWETSSTARIRVELADFGVHTNLAPNGYSAYVPVDDERFDDERLRDIGSKLARLPNLLSFTLETGASRMSGAVDLALLKRLTALRELTLHTQVSNLEPLKGLTALEYLDLTGTQVKNLEPIYESPNLRVLKVEEPLQTQFVQYRQTKGLPYVKW